MRYLANGRIERFIGTFKTAFRFLRASEAMPGQSGSKGSTSLASGTTLRPHQHLEGLTPAQAWQGASIICKDAPVSVWKGALVGAWTPN
jgi:hypothetical protein